MGIWRLLPTSILLISASIGGQMATAWAQVEDVLSISNCGSLQNAYGPFDYTDPVHFHEKLPIVEGYHFNSDVESLRKGMTGVYPGSDIDYTLRAFPNHHRALNSMANLALKHKDKKVPPGANYSGECYFQRAMRFRPNDITVRMVYGIYLVRLNQLQRAQEQFEKAVELDPQNAEANYNLGLIYEKLGKDELAVKHAHVAYDKGFPLNGLRDILNRKGIWEPVEKAPDP